MVAVQLGLEFVNIDEYPVDASCAGLITDSLARRYSALPIGWEDQKLVVAMDDPSNVFAIDDIRTITGADVKVVVGTRAAIHAAIDKYHRLDSEAEQISAQAGLDARARGRPLERQGGLRGRADRQAGQPADHPGRGRPRIRHPHRAERARRARPLPHRRRAPRGDAPAEEHPVAASPRRLKIMADINIAERRIPQDGRVVGDDRRQAGRPPRRDAADGLRREDRHAYPRQVDGAADPRRPRLPARVAGPLRAVVHASRTARSWSPVRPVRASRRRSTPRSTSSTRRPRTSSPSRTRSSTACPASTRCRSTTRPA